MADRSQAERDRYKTSLGVVYDCLWRHHRYDVSYDASCESRCDSFYISAKAIVKPR